MGDNLWFLTLIGNLLNFQIFGNSTISLGDLHQYLINPFSKPSLSHIITVGCGKSLTFIGPRMVSLWFPRWSPSSISVPLYRGRMRRGWGHGVWSWFSFHGDQTAYPSIPQGSGSHSGTVMVAWIGGGSSWSIFFSTWGSWSGWKCVI